MNEEYKKQVYKRWVEKGRPWFDIDKSKEPTYEERQIILEMKKKEQNVKSKYDRDRTESKTNQGNIRQERQNF